MAQAPAPTTNIPMTPPLGPADDAVRVTVGARQGWKLVDGSIVFDDGEKVVPPSGKSDAEKRAEALAYALGDQGVPAEQVSNEELNHIRSEVVRLSVSDPLDVRKKAAKKLATMAPAATAEEMADRMAALPPSQEQQMIEVRRKARSLIDLETIRIEQLKEMAGLPGVVLSRDGLPQGPRSSTDLNNHLVAAHKAAEAGDVARMAAHLAELKRWSLMGDHTEEPT